MKFIDNRMAWQSVPPWERAGVCLKASVSQVLNDVLGVGAAVQGAASIANGVMSYNASEDASQRQYQSTQDALNFQKNVYGNEQTQIAPYLASGQSNLNALNAQMPQLTAGFDPTQHGLSAQFDPTQSGLAKNFSYSAQDFQVDPGYQFALDQGLQAVQRSAASKGLLNSGGAVKAVNDYAQGQADQQYSTAYNRAQNTYQQNYSNADQAYQQNYGNAFNTYTSNQNNAFNKYATLAGQGLSATGVANQAGQSYANAAGSASIQGGNAQAAGIVGSTNGLATGMSGAANALTSYEQSDTYNPYSSTAASNSSYGNSGAGNMDGFGLVDTSGGPS